MSHDHCIQGKRPQFLGPDHKTTSVSFFRYLLRYLYGANEPALIRQVEEVA